MVLVVEINEFAEVKMPCDRGSLLTDAFHQIAIAAFRVGVVIDNLVSGPVIPCCQPRLCDSQADPVGEPLPERSSRHFDSRRQAALRVPGRLATPFSEMFDFLERKVITGKIEKAVQQHRPMSARQYETIAVEPLRVPRIVLQKTGPQRVRHRGRTHRHAGMARVRVLDGVRREYSYRVDAAIFEIFIDCHNSPTDVCLASTDSNAD